MKPSTPNAPQMMYQQNGKTWKILEYKSIKKSCYAVTLDDVLLFPRVLFGNGLRRRNYIPELYLKLVN